eukprot:9497870-Pyramimonas_sp.AAC.2
MVSTALAASACARGVGGRGGGWGGFGNVSPRVTRNFARSKFERSRRTIKRWNHSGARCVCFCFLPLRSPQRRTV